MSESAADAFVWTFPLHIVAGNFDADSEGNPTFRADSYYVAPKADGEPYLAVFTDVDLAQDYIAHCNPALHLQSIACSPGAMLVVLKRAELEGRWKGFLIDPSPRGQSSRLAPFSNLIDAIEQHFGVDAQPEQKPSQ